MTDLEIRAEGVGDGDRVEGVGGGRDGGRNRRMITD